MKNNKLPLIENKEDGLVYEFVKIEAQNRLRKLYNKLKNQGGWRAVAEKRGSKNQQYVYNFAMHGIEPPVKNIDERKACYLPQKFRARMAQLSAWLRRVKKNIAHLAKETRDAVAKG